MTYDNKLGAWSAKSGAAYVRTVRKHTARIQEIVALELEVRKAEGGTTQWRMRKLSKVSAAICAITKSMSPKSSSSVES